MSNMDAVLENVKKTSDALNYMQNNAVGTGNPLMNSLDNFPTLQPPSPFKGRNKPKATNNDGLLRNEIENLKELLANKDAEIQKIQLQLSESYAVVAKFREEFETNIGEVADSLIEKVCLFQNGVYESIQGKQENPL